MPFDHGADRRQLHVDFAVVGERYRPNDFLDEIQQFSGFRGLATARSKCRADRF